MPAEAWRWQQWLEGGRCRSIRELAEAQRVSHAHVSRVPKLIVDVGGLAPGVGVLEQARRPVRPVVLAPAPLERSRPGEAQLVRPGLQQRAPPRLGDRLVDQRLRCLELRPASMRPRHFCRGRGLLCDRVCVAICGFNEAPAFLPGKRIGRGSLETCTFRSLQ
jgi:hypothetical protein